MPISDSRTDNYNPEDYIEGSETPRNPPNSVLKNRLPKVNEGSAAVATSKEEVEVSKRKIRQTLKGINDINQWINNTMQAVGDADPKAQREIRNLTDDLKKARDISDSVLAQGEEVSRQDAVKLMTTLNRIDNYLERNKKIDFGETTLRAHLKDFERKNKLETLASKDISDRLNLVSKKIGENVGGFLASNIGAISIEGLSDQVGQHMATAALGPLGPIVSSFVDFGRVTDSLKESAGNAFAKFRGEGLPKLVNKALGEREEDEDEAADLASEQIDEQKAIHGGIDSVADEVVKVQEEVAAVAEGISNLQETTAKSAVEDKPVQELSNVETQVEDIKKAVAEGMQEGQSARSRFASTRPRDARGRFIKMTPSSSIMQRDARGRFVKAGGLVDRRTVRKDKKHKDELLEKLGKANTIAEQAEADTQTYREEEIEFREKTHDMIEKGLDDVADEAGGDGGGLLGSAIVGLGLIYTWFAKGGFMGMIKKVSGFIVKRWPLMLLGPIGAVLGTALIAFAPKIISEVLPKITASMTTFFANFKEKAGLFIQDVTKSTVSFIKDTGGMIKGTLTASANKVLDIIDSMLSKATALGGIIAEQARTAATFVADLSGRAIDKVASVGSALAQMARDGLSKAGEAVSAAATSIFGAYESAVGWLRQLSAKAGEIVSTLPFTILDLIKTNVLAPISGFISNAIAEFKDSLIGKGFSFLFSKLSAGHAPESDGVLAEQAPVSEDPRQAATLAQFESPAEAMVMPRRAESAPETARPRVKPAEQYKPVSVPEQKQSNVVVQQRGGRSIDEMPYYPGDTGFNMVNLGTL